RRGRVAGGRARYGLDADAFGVRDPDGHAAILERAGGVVPLVLHLEGHAGPATDGIARDERRGALGVRYDLAVRDRREHELAVAPHAGATPVGAQRHALGERAAQRRGVQRHVVPQLEQAAAVTLLARIVLGELRAATLTGLLGHLLPR